MPAFLAFHVHLRPPEVIRHAGNTEAMDWFVLATLCFFFFLLGCFAVAAWCLWRRSSRPEPHVKLLMELAETDADHVIHAADQAAQEPSSRDPGEGWERRPDWWKL